MTKTETIRALEMCQVTEDGVDCENCPYFDRGVNCINYLHEDALAVIKSTDRR